MKLKYLAGIIIIFINGLAYSQNGTVRGTIFDRSTGEYLPGVTIFAESTSNGTITDLEGQFSLDIPAGTYNLRISFISYETIILENIEVERGETTVLDELGMETANINIEEVVITGQSIRNTENSMIALRKNSANVMDGISAASFRKIGDSDAAASMKRVSGVSVTGGKYVFVRGLGDRYTKTTLNGMDVPGLDPDRNTIQMDLFPTSIIDNIVVHKSFSAELPADFTGGVVDIEIKDFPSSKQGSFSLGGAYNPAYHFNPEYLAYPGGSTDFLGFDDGTRQSPATSNIPEFAYALGDPDGPLGQRYTEILNSFNPQMAAMKSTSLMDYSFSLSYGNQHTRESRTNGFNFAFSYKNNTEFYENAIDARYSKDARPDVYQLDVSEYQVGNYGVNSVFLSGLVGYAFKNQHSRIRANLMHLQNGESKAGIFDFEGSDEGSNFSALQHTLDFSQRSLTNLFINGKHNLDDSGWDLEWKISPTLSTIEDPDVRFSRYKIDGDNIEIGTEVGFPERIWRNLLEVNMANSIHAERDFSFLGRNATFMTGGAYTFKFRNYSIQSFKLNIRGGDTGQVPLTGDPNELLTDELKWPYQGDLNYGTTFENDLNKANQYLAMVNYGAAYVAADVNLLDNLKTELGVRVEKYYQTYTGQNQTGDKVLDNDEVMNDLKLFPALNMIYNITDVQNLRFSFSRTIARPSLKELSFAEIYDPLSGRTFIGGLHPEVDNEQGIVYWDGNLKSTDIQNFDLRWEYFSTHAQMITFSGFYKKFLNPIEMVQFETQTGAFQPRNVGDGQVLGAEFEFRQSLSFISESLSAMSISSNVTYTESRISMSIVEYNSRLENAKNGEAINDTRAMAGQSPYIINAGISYNGNGTQNGFWNNIEAGLFYNVQGRTLQYVGISDIPDVYSEPFHSLNFNSNLVLGSDDRIKIGLKVSNILNEKKEWVYDAYNATNPYFEYRYQGTTFSVSLGYAFF